MPDTTSLTLKCLSLYRRKVITDLVVACFIDLVSNTITRFNLIVEGVITHLIGLNVVPKHTSICLIASRLIYRALSPLTLRLGGL